MKKEDPTHPMPTVKDLFIAANHNPMVKAWLAVWQNGELSYEQMLIGLATQLVVQIEKYQEAIKKLTDQVDSAVKTGTIKIEMPSLWPDLTEETP